MVIADILESLRQFEINVEIDRLLTYDEIELAIKQINIRRVPE